MQKPFSAFLFLFALLAFGCGKSNETPDNAATWIVTKFVDLAPPTGQVDITDDTARFTGFSFDFAAGDLLSISYPNGTTLDGKWRLLPGNTSLAVSVETPPTLIEEIIGTWDVVEYSATKIKLQNPNPVGSVDFSKQAVTIEFEKI
ncbi:MAG: hypothetical protein ACKVU2_05615 [Saprospiraceae bacterium]